MIMAQIHVDGEYCNMYDTADSGQCFRWYKLSDGSVAFVFGSCAAIAICDGKGYEIYAWSRELNEKEIREKVLDYLDFGTDYGKVIGSVDPEDLYLKKASEAAKGIRLLNQEIWETSVSFMISQNNNIPRIKKSVSGICRRFGKKIDIPAEIQKRLENMWNISWPEELEYTFPSPEAIDPENLSGLGLGYRESYIKALILSAVSRDEENPVKKALSGRLTPEDAHEELMKVKGIGNKVASCIELYGLHYKGAFPVDRWVRRIEDEHYGGTFPKEKYPGTAGIMQQYMFFYERSL